MRSRSPRLSTVVGRERDLLPAANQLEEDHAATVLVGQLAERVLGDARGSSAPRRAAPSGNSRSSRSSTSAPNGASSAQNTSAARRDGDDVPRLEQGFGRRFERSALPRRMRSTKTRSAAKERSRSATLGRTACRPAGRRGCPRPCRPDSDLGIVRRSRGISASSLRLSSFRLTLSSRGARRGRNQTTKPVPTR